MRLNLIKSNNENKKIADKIFFEILKMHGVNSIRRKVWYLAVRLFGKKSTIKIQDNDKIKETD
jgi:arabinogalactan endo-1,4-beta-galactosidase